MGIEHDPNRSFENTRGQSSQKIVVNNMGLAKISAVAAAYAVIGYFSLQMAISPGYPMPFWPAAGIALGSVLIWGYRAAYGVFLGSLCLNLSHAAPWIQDWNGIHILSPFAIGGGAALQAVLGAWLAKLWRQKNRTTLQLIHEKEVAQFLFFAVPVSCIIGASIGVGCLVATGEVSTDLGLLNWFSWWAGDVVGAATFSTALLALATTEKALRYRKIKLVALPMLGLLVLFAAAYSHLAESKREREKYAFQVMGDEVKATIQNKITFMSDVLDSVNSFWISSRDVTKDEFSTFMGPLVRKYSGLQRVIFAPWVAASEWHSFYQQEQSLYANLPEPAPAAHSWVAPVLYSEWGREDGISMRGIDIAPKVKIAGKPLIAVGGFEPVDISSSPQFGTMDIFVQSPSDEILAKPFPVIFRSVGTKRRNLPILPLQTEDSGLLVAVLDLDAAIKEAIAASTARNLDWDFSLIADGAPSLLSSAENQSLNLKVKNSDLSYVAGIDILGATFKFSLKSGEFSAAGLSQDFQESWFFLVVMIFVILSANGLLLSISGREVLITNLVEEKTKELGLARAQSEHSSRLASLGMMAGGIAHEINTPLMIIDGYASEISSGLRDGVSNETLSIYSEKIATTVHRIADIIKALRASSREDSRDPLAAVSMKEVLEETMTLCAEQFDKENIDLSVQISATCPEYVLGKKAGLLQTILNLLGNSRDVLLTKDDGLRQIMVEISFEDPWVCLRVVDNGPGIALGHEHLVLEPFFTTKPVGRGTGLGLSVSASLIYNLGGELLLEKPRNKTTFLIRLKPAPDENCS